MEKYWNEQWKDIILPEGKFRENYWFQISNYGRVKRFSKQIPTGEILKLGNTAGYATVRLKQLTGKWTGMYVQRLVAEYFIPNDDKNKNVVIHKDYDRLNNVVTNLEWATKKERNARKLNNPFKKNRTNTNSKLTVTEVIRLKKKLNDPNRKTRLKILAKQFGVSEMQLHRIKTGENWGYI